MKAKNPGAPVRSGDTLVLLEGHHGAFVLQRAYSDLNYLVCNAIYVSGDCMTIRDSIALNVDFGITVSGNNALVSGTLVENFSGDGMRGLGNNLGLAYNVVKNCGYLS